ncbi:MAG TPA: prepilin-type N-terminal cleavage/methylation domain-containing protein [Candidatus Saccharimonadales bacterium]|nr:prepilin-type N-terminal cleavage/methylation domain-containing protein [Candidatus Saccharimonadales bacterium]
MRSPSLRSQSGFTIVETIIVLAIAGIILLIVLLAIPVLKRNSTNNQRTQDVQTVLQAVSTYELNHSGTIPNTVNLHNFLNTYEKNKLTYYDLNNRNSIRVSTPNATDTLQTYPPVTTPITLDNMLVNNHAKCVPGGTATNQGAGYSDVVALYAIETASGSVPHCQQL